MMALLCVKQVSTVTQGIKNYYYINVSSLLAPLVPCRISNFPCR